MVDSIAALKPSLAMMLVAGVLAACASPALATAVADGRAEEAAASPDAVRARALAAYGHLPMLFEAIDGDPARGRAFMARGAGYQAAIFAQGALIALPVPDVSGATAAEGRTVTVVDLAFSGADAAAAIRGVDAQAARIHRLRGRAGVADRIDVPTYAQVAIDGLYPGIDAVFYGDGRRLEYDLVVAPGADPSRIRLQLGGIRALTLVEGGDLRIDTGHGSMTLRHPLAYQESDGQRVPVESRYVQDGPRAARIEVGVYDATRTLVIDPVVSYATFVGGTSSEHATAIAVDASGNAYIAGHTISADFPTLSAYDRSLGKRNDTDIFVAKINPAGTGLVYATYLGGSTGIDRALGIALDPAGNAYVAGITSGGDFPVSANAYQPAIASGGSVIAKLAPAGNALVYSTYLWGATVAAIAVDGSGNALVTGNASSGFVTTAEALQRTIPPGLADTGFVLKLDPAGTAPLYATFLPGNDINRANAIAVDLHGNAYVAGWTTAADFPTINAWQPALKGQKDGFVAKLDPPGTRLVYATFLGGSLDDAVNAIAVDGDGNAYVAGETYSPDYPSLNGFQPVKSGFRLVNSSLGNAFVTKLDATGSALQYSSFLGGEICTAYCEWLAGLPQYPGDVAYGIAVDRAGHAFVTGLAETYTFPLVDSTAPRKQQDNQNSAFVAKVSAAGGKLLFSTFTRTGYAEFNDRSTRFPPGSATGVATDAGGAAYVTGDADGASNFQATPGAFQTVSGGGLDAVVVKFAAPQGTLVLETSNPSIDTQTGASLIATLTGSAASGSVALMSGPNIVAYAPLVGSRAVFDLALPVGIHSLVALLATPGSFLDSAPVQQVVDNPLACVR